MFKCQKCHMNHVSASYILLYHWSAFWQVGIAHFTDYGMLHFGFDNISEIGFCNIKAKKFIIVLILWQLAYES